jgi:hypothetical protein
MTMRAALVLRHGWLQKHPTPTTATGEFHWHPAAALDGERGDLRLALVDRLRGVAPPAALWQLAPGRVVWAQVFAATAPGDGRRYCGLAVTTIEAPGATAADLLASLVVPPAAPWDGEPSERTVELVRAEPAPLSSTQRAHRDTVLPAPGGVVRALISGGPAAVADPARPDLPAWIASLEAWLPAAIHARPRQGEWRGGVGGPRLGAGDDDPVADAVLAAWCPRDPAAAPRMRRAWTALVELAASQGRGLDDVATEIHDPAELALERALTMGERAHLPPARGAGIEAWIHAIHHWGRGRLDGSPAAATLVTRIADLVIERAIADHVAGDGAPGRAIDRVRWHALLPADRRRRLLAAIAARAPSLAELVERAPRATGSMSLGESTAPPINHRLEVTRA